MKQTLEARLTQQLTLTPQLQQAIRLLLLSSQELRQEIEQTIELNPLLEYEDDIVVESQTEENETNSAETNSDEALDLEQTQLSDELPVDTQWEDIYPTANNSGVMQSESQTFEIQGVRTEGLLDHLLWQMRLSRFSDTDAAIAIATIDAINEDGFLTCSLEEIYAGLGNTEEIDLDEVQAVLRRIQSFDPPGVGARDLRECLLLQLRQYPETTPYLFEALTIVSHHLDLLGHHDYRQLLKVSKLKDHQISEALKLIHVLNPKPGSLIRNEEVEYVIPDVITCKRGNAWQIKINPLALPRLRINNNYADLLKNNSADPKYQSLKTHLQEARFFIKSVTSRNETLLKVASNIVKRQQAFLEHGEEYMRPLILQTVANDLGFHESTISRITTQKYLHTPRGVFELKYFFSSHLSTEDGQECSSTAIRAMIKKFIAEENSLKPLSDKKIVDLLAAKGIQVARRTVAKYREEMAILPSNERKSFS